MTIPEPGGSVSQIKQSPVLKENVIFSDQGFPRKSWGTYLHVKLKNNWGSLSSLFLILAIKMHFLPIYCNFYPLIILAVNWKKCILMAKIQKSEEKKTDLFDLTDTSPWLSDGH